MSSLISVIIPIYNVEEYLERCLNSIVNQTYKDLEIILIDDGSTDDGLSICRKYESVDNRIKVFSQKNGGVSSARNAGLAIASGEYVVFMDPDDWIENNMYENMYNLITQKKADVCICNYYQHRGQKIKPIIFEFDEELINQEKICENIILNMISALSSDSNKKTSMRGIWRLLISKSIIVDNAIEFPIEVSLMEDLIFSIRVFTKAKTVCYDRSIHYHYCIREKSASSIYRANMFDIQLYVFSIIESILEGVNLQGIAKKRLDVRYINTCITSIKNEISRENKKSFHDKINSISKFCRNERILDAVNSLNTKDYNLRKKIILNAIKNNKPIFLYLYYSFRLKIKKIMTALHLLN